MPALWLSLTVLDAWVTVHGGEANINPWLLRGLYVYILVWLTAIWAPICESHARQFNGPRSVGASARRGRVIAESTLSFAPCRPTVPLLLVPRPPGRLEAHLPDLLLTIWRSTCFLLVPSYSWRLLCLRLHEAHLPDLRRRQPRRRGHRAPALLLLDPQRKP